MKIFENKVGELLATHIPELTKDEIIKSIEIPSDSKLGNFAFPCFKLAKIYKNSPNNISEDISKKIEDTEFFSKIENNAAYINFFINEKKLAKVVLDEIINKQNDYGKSTMGNGEKIIVEFSSTNIAKPFHIGHIRSTVIGNAIKNIYDFLGYDTVAINHLGDYGTQFGMAIAAYKKWGDREVIEKDPINEILKLYVKFNAEIEEDPSLKDEARYWFKELEQKNEDALAIWSWIREISLKEFDRVYDMLNIKFDSYAGESFYSDKMDGVLNILKEKNLLVESDGALIVDLSEYNMPPAIVQKADGSTIYLTRDIAAAVYRKNFYDFNKNLYVVASQQNLHFKQLFKVLELMGYPWFDDCIHIPFGMISMKEGSMSTRKGRVIFLEDVLNQAIDKTRKTIEERNPNLENKEIVAKQVGIGAVIFQELFNNRIKDYVFDFDKILNFEGETGPYVQYTHARACSLLENGNFNIEDSYNSDLLTTKEEKELLISLGEFPSCIIDSMKKSEPFFITRNIIDISQKFNSFYANCPINSSAEDLKKARLALVFATKTVIKTALGILGIDSPIRM